MVVIIGGCSYIGTNQPASPEIASPAPSLATSAVPSSVPSEAVRTVLIEPPLGPTPSASPTPTATATLNDPTPFPTPSHVAGLAASDRFWENWFEWCWFGAFDIVVSVADITSQSHVVLTGTISDLYIKRPWDDFQPVYAKVSITEILKGEPASEEPGTVEVQIGFLRSGLEELRSSLPGHGHLWFLVQDEHGAASYYTTDYEQVSVLRDIGGVVRVILPDRIARAYSRRHYPVPLDGTSFEELVDRVRELADEPSAATQSFARWKPPGELDTNRFFAC